MNSLKGLAQDADMDVARQARIGLGSSAADEFIDVGALHNLFGNIFYCFFSNIIVINRIF